MSKKVKKYQASPKGKRALKRARKKYDRKDPEKRRKQKREYMRRWREKQRLLILEEHDET